MLQGPPGDISDPIALEKSMIPKTMWCSNGTFGTICRTPFSTSGSIYQFGNTPTFDSTKGAYITPSGALRIGDWQISQSTAGNLEFINTNSKISNPFIKVNGIDTSNIKSDVYHSRDRNNVINSSGNIDTANIRSDAYHARNRNNVIDGNGAINTNDINVNNNVIVGNHLQANTVRGLSWVMANGYHTPARNNIIDGNGNINTGYITAWDVRANGAFYGRVA
jgi:hypothetical protein